MSSQENGQVPVKSKYHSRKVEVDGIKFDSSKEAKRYKELILLQKTGTVLEIELQPSFVLQEGYKRFGKSIRPITYRADFKVKWKDGRVQIIDTKGFKTKDYLIKKKILLFKYPELDFVEE